MLDIRRRQFITLLGGVATWLVVAETEGLHRERFGRSLVRCQWVAPKD
jgi:hypothetical protein